MNVTCKTKLLAIQSLCLILLMTCAASAARQTFAYIAFNDGTIRQYRVTAGGRFVALTPPTVPGKRTGIMDFVAHPSGRYVYALDDSDYDVHAFRVGENGNLTLIRIIDPSPGVMGMSPDRIAFDSTGRYAYITLNTSGTGDVAALRVNKDGSLSPLKPLTYRAGQAPDTLGASPSAPFLYVVNFASATVSQYRINKSGSLTPLNPPQVTVMPSPGYIAFSQDGKHAFMTGGEDELLLGVCNVRADGCLSRPRTVRFGGGLSAGQSYPSQIAVGPTGVAFVADYGVGDLVALQPSRGRAIESTGQFCLTRDNKAAGEGKMENRAMEHIAAVTGKPARPLRNPKSGAWDVPAVNAAAKSLVDITATPYAAAFGPDGMLYVLNSSGVARFKVVETRKPIGHALGSPMIGLDPQTPALVWPDMNAEYEAWRTTALKKGMAAFMDDSKNPSMHEPRFLVFASR